MRRWFLIFFGLLIAGHLLWPFLREIGLARLPGDVVLEWQGAKFRLAFATSLLITSILAGTWRLLDRN